NAVKSAPAPIHASTAGTIPAATHTVSSTGTGNAGSTAPLPANRVTDVDFRRNANDAGRVEITLTGSGGPIDVNRHNGNIVAILPDTHLPPRLEKRLAVQDFATPVKYVDLFSRGTNTRIVVTPFNGADF